MPRSEFGELEAYVVPVGEDACAGRVFDAFKTVLLFRLASLTGKEEATEFPATPAPGTGEAERLTDCVTAAGALALTDWVTALGSEAF